MGAAAARRLLSRGHNVAVWNRTPARAEPLRAHGAHIARTPAEAAEHADVVLVFLADAAAVEATILGGAGAATSLRPGATVVQMSTIGPEAIKQLVTRLPDGARLLDARVKGSVPAAETGTLEIYVGGDETVLASVSATLADLGTLLHCGDVGTASALKLVINASMILAVAALTEVTSLAHALDLPVERTREAIISGPLSGGLNRAEAKGADFPVAHASKDLNLARTAVPDASALKAADQLLSDVTDRSADLGVIVHRL